MKISWRTEWPNWLVLAAMFVIAGLRWGTAPDRIPVHWNLAGEVDRYGGRFEGLLAVPLLALAIYLLMLFLPRIDPGRANYPAFAGAYATLRLGIVVVLAVVYGLVHLWLLGHRVSISTWVPLVVGALFVVVGNLMGKIRPNWFVGIRTPWTLSSKLAWLRTHRLGGWVFVLMGVLFMAAAMLRTEWAVWIAAGGVLASTMGLVVYSYVVWRGDPDKVPPAGTAPAGEEE